MATLPPIYWINLDRAHERRTRMFARFAGRGLAETRVAAIDGRLEMVSDEMHPREAARVASHLRAIERAYADGVPWALVMEDDTTFELFDVWVDGFGTIERSLPTRFGTALLSLGGAPRELDRIFRRTALVLPVEERDLGSTGAYVIERDAMRALLDRCVVDGNYDLSSLARGGHALRSIVGTPGAVFSRIPLFLSEARDSDVHPSSVAAQRTSRAFVLEHHHALLRRTYVSPFTWRARVRGLWSADLP